uniref:beta-N-acetylhexosaminidase n=1 Tax=Streptomyces corallincola TaxID=2851888 RepID=UPI0027E2B79A|nr:glycoside hydrolase family 20 protein [Streptomyces corallincola]
MSQHRRRPAADQTRRKRAVVAAVVAGTVALGVGVGVWASSGGDGSPSGDGTTQASSDRAATSATPSPTRSYPLSEAPRTIPAVSSHTAERGPGWQPKKGGRVLIGDPGLADEGKLIAGELGLTYAGEGNDAAPGDLRLSLGGSGGAESYTMTVRGGRVDITGPGEAGVFYGTRTLKQEVHGGGTAPEGVVRDTPAKQVRGFMLDIARKPFTEDWIENEIRTLGDLKYNELGLHFSDDQAFRIQSTTHPEIVSPVHLTQDQVRRIIAVADSRHITVVPEIDSPGHLGAVLAHYPDLQLRNAQGVPTRGAIDISEPAAAKLVDDLLNEFTGLFRGRQWNLGGDEYQALTVSDPEASYPQLATAARQRFGADGTVADLTTQWLNDRADTVRAHQRTMRAWNDGFYADSSVPAAKDLQVAYWTGKEIGAREPVTYLDAGRRLINYNDEYLYYVLGEPQTFVYPTGERIYEQWTPRVIRHTSPVPARYDSQILGGTFAVWCDFPNAQTQDQVAAGIRLPLAATVQKLWDADQPALSWPEFQKLANGLV